MNMLTKPVAVGMAALGFMGASATSQAAEWEWKVAPYLWAASIGTDLETDRFPSVSNRDSFSDIIDKIDGAFQMHAEGQGERFGVFGDYTFLGLGDSKNFDRFGTRSQLDSQLLELAAVWNPADGRYSGLDVFAGLRYIDVDLDVKFEPDDPLLPTVERNVNDSYADFMVGLRYTWNLSDRWALTMRGDGSFGDTEGTWNASAIAQYRVKWGSWAFGYRYLSVEVESGPTSTDITMSGPAVGFAFTF
ncbi:hypothetical protein J2X06_002878 [Lysobacter niastensis]|uniref:Outer membrane protein beta-barrel domain-containing protein n=1 Tax=Lysobacter niastensis TaxID=380629 RepID=A0ABU1WE50_9GAMM|nr:hypothetical protein [Lysobacter niastensis]MDR7135669.1 hypothetical protein [Lysobacter niastensis]